MTANAAQLLGAVLVSLYTGGDCVDGRVSRQPTPCGSPWRQCLNRTAMTVVVLALVIILAILILALEAQDMTGNDRSATGHGVIESIV